MSASTSPPQSPSSSPHPGARRGRLPNLTPLQWALGVSLAAHALLLGLRLGAPEAFDRTFQNPPLSVILVNRASPTPPQRPQALAQADLDGGGSARSGLAATPLPAAERNAAGDAPRDARTVLQRLQHSEREMLSAARSQIVMLQHTVQAHDAAPQVQQALEEQHRELLDLIGAIERRIELNNASPRRRFVGPSTRSVPYALYYDHMRQKIERLGTADFPQRDGRKLYGRLIMAITVDSGGRVLRAEVVRGSGDATLDRMARAIVEAAQPFGTFDAGMLRDADQIVVVAGFDFTREGGLNTDMHAASPTPRAPQPPAAAARP
ncbi:MAG: TonB family protein [Betaproteobacteria bacterium]|nr:TonB family protein [Betaproteobacteria bacterium]